MKKKVILFLIALVLCIPFLNVNADVTATDLATTVSEEYALVADNDDYADYAKIFKNFDSETYAAKKDDAKVTVYVFRGSTCSHCLEAMAHFASIYSDYSDKIDIETYEVWSNDDNASLMESVASALGTEAEGVPFIVIGEKYFSGYSSTLDEDIASAIETAYEDDEYTDLVKTVAEGGEVTSKEDSGDTAIIIAILVVVIGGCGALVYFSRKK